MFVPLVAVLYALLLSVVQPFKYLISSPTTPTTPPHTVPTQQYIPPDCISDDDGDCTVSSSGSSLAAPLHSSHSSEGSAQKIAHHTNYFSPEDSLGPSNRRESSPLKQAMTSPGPRRGRFFARTPGVSPGKRLFFDFPAGRQSPELTPSNRRVEDDDSDVELVTMKPQSLAATFDYFSDED